jgi:hypothetical protein
MEIHYSGAVRGLVRRTPQAIRPIGKSRALTHHSQHGSPQRE